MPRNLLRSVMANCERSVRDAAGPPDGRRLSKRGPPSGGVRVTRSSRCSSSSLRILSRWSLVSFLSVTAWSSSLVTPSVMAFLTSSRLLLWSLATSAIDLPSRSLETRSSRLSPSAEAAASSAPPGPILNMRPGHRCRGRSRDRQAAGTAVRAADARPAEDAAVLRTPRLDRVGLLLGELAVLDGLVELAVLRRAERRAQRLRRDVQPLGRVGEDRLLGLLAVVITSRRRDGSSSAGSGGEDGCGHQDIALDLHRGSIAHGP